MLKVESGPRSKRGNKYYAKGQELVDKTTHIYIYIYNYIYIYMSNHESYINIHPGNKSNILQSSPSKHDAHVYIYVSWLS